MDIRFDKKVVLITGASSGIGRATAIEFAKSGANVVVHYNESKKEAEQVVEKIRSLGTKVIAIKADVTQNNEVQKLVNETLERFETIDVLVNNAGSLVQRKSIQELDENLWNKVMEVNLKSTFLVSHGVIPTMKKNNSGKIINVTSVAARTGGSLGTGHYSAAKAGIIALSKNMAKELGPFNIIVNAVSPGIINTRFHNRYTSPDNFNQLTNGVVIKRAGTPQECAWPILFMASDYACYIVGETLEINGGILMD